mmetsp:Transcript_81220/g.230068  ORF Transcript_81220/g.230068 Transcript_81220/m.230068 type:complete len:177 (+) Transcript_81220:123-653(+)
MFGAQMGALGDPSSLIDPRFAALAAQQRPDVSGGAAGRYLPEPLPGPGLPPSPARGQFLNPVSAQGIKLCSNCGGRGHVSKVCPSPKECDCCGAIKHQKAQCPHASRRCQICSKRGHMAMKCAQKDLVISQLSGGGKGKGAGKGKDREQDKTCWDHAKGNCRHGDQCKWMHVGAMG